MLELLSSHGEYFAYLGIIVFLILTGGGLPIPEEVPIVMAGVWSSHVLLPPGEAPFLNVSLAYASCLIGALLGDLLVYSIGRYLGHNFLRKHPRFAHLLHEEREKHMELLIQKHGLKVFFIARFMVGVRAPLYLAAGALRMSWRRFLAVDAICATIVVTAVFWLSHQYGRIVGDTLRRSQMTLTLIIVLAVLLVIGYYLVHRRKKKLKDATDETDTTPDSGENRSDTSRIVA